MGLKDKLGQQLDAAARPRFEREQEDRPATMDVRPGDPSPSATRPRFEYDVVEVREKLIGARGSAPSDKLRTLLNERAAEGWQYKNLVSGDVAGMIGKREGWMVVFERPLQ